MHACSSSATLQLQCGAIILDRNADNCNLPAAIIVSSTSFYIVINNILSVTSTISPRRGIFLGVSTSSKARLFGISEFPEIVLKCNHQLLSVIILPLNAENNYFG